MDPKYHAAYAALQDPSVSSFSRRLPEDLQREIVSVLADWYANFPLRADAAHFLTLNAIGMVIEPIFLAHGGSLPGSVNNAPLAETLRADIDKICWRAHEIAKARGRTYISATSVAIALGELADSLAITAFQIWGPRPGEEGSDPADAGGGAGGSQAAFDAGAGQRSMKEG
jgi:hypothetical protein